MKVVLGIKGHTMKSNVTMEVKSKNFLALPDRSLWRQNVVKTLQPRPIWERRINRKFKFFKTQKLQITKKNTLGKGSEEPTTVLWRFEFGETWRRVHWYVCKSTSYFHSQTLLSDNSRSCPTLYLQVCFCESNVWTIWCVVDRAS